MLTEVSHQLQADGDISSKRNDGKLRHVENKQRMRIIRCVMVEMSLPERATNVSVPDPGAAFGRAFLLTGVGCVQLLQEVVVDLILSARMMVMT